MRRFSTPILDAKNPTDRLSQPRFENPRLRSPTPILDVKILDAVSLSVDRDPLDDRDPVKIPDAVFLIRSHGAELVPSAGEGDTMIFGAEHRRRRHGDGDQGRGTGPELGLLALHCDANNVSAIGLYKGQGFRCISVLCCRMQDDPNKGPLQVKRLYDTFHEPFRWVSSIKEGTEEPHSTNEAVEVKGDKADTTIQHECSISTYCGLC